MIVIKYLGILIAGLVIISSYPAHALYAQPTLEVKEFETIETKLTPFSELSEQKASVTISATNFASSGATFTLTKPIYEVVKGSFDVKTDYPEPSKISETPARSEYSWDIYLDGQRKGKWKEELKFDVNTNREPLLFIREGIVASGKAAKLERSGNFYVVKDSQIQVGDRIKFLINIQGNLKTWTAGYFPIINGTITKGIYYKVFQAQAVLSLPAKYFRDFEVTGDYIKTKEIEPIIQGDNWVLTIPFEIGPYASRSIYVESTVIRAGDIEIDPLTVSFAYDGKTYEYSTPSLGDFPTLKFTSSQPEIDGKFYVTHKFTVFQLKIPIDPSLEPQKSSLAYVAREDILCDSIVAGTYAAVQGSPVFLVRSDGLSVSDTELFLKAKSSGLAKITIVGGNQAVSSEVENQLKQLGFEVERIFGVDRTETAANFALKKWGSSTTAVLVYGNDVPTQLSAGSLAARLQSPILFVSSDALPTQTKAALAELRSKKAILIYRGNASITSIAQQLQMLGVQVQIINGKDIVETSVKVGEEFANLIIKTSTVFLVQESLPKFSQGLVPLAQINLAPIFVCKGPELPEDVEGYIFDKDVKRIVVFGKIIPKETEDYLRAWDIKVVRV
ncbi:MAG: cell wall-binding repeat-containing protein [Euryarchaeota archaeon]|nr:cell wall-binding repeat-containing protein [Euryarchaeota archaeon]